MAYQTAAPASTSAVIADFIAWAVSEGGFTLGNTWTYTVSSVGYTARSLGRDGQHANLAWKTTSPDRLFLNSSSNHPTTGQLTAQTNCAAVNAEIVLGTSPVRYHMFADGYSAHAAVEWKGGAYQHINIGYLEKLGTYTGGLYINGSYWQEAQYAQASTALYHCRPFDFLLSRGDSGNSRAGHVRCSFNGYSIHAFMDSFGAGGVAANLGPGRLASGDIDCTVIDRAPNTYNGRSIIIPTIIAVAETDSATPASWIPIGQVKNAGHVNIANLNPGDAVNTDWMVFPWSAKNTGGVAGTQVNSLNYGIAYKK